MDLKDRILGDFSYHPPMQASLAKFTSIRAKALELAQLLVDNVPESRELSTALTRLEEFVMHANAGIARNQYDNDIL